MCSTACLLTFFYSDKGHDDDSAESDTHKDACQFMYEILV